MRKRVLSVHGLHGVLDDELLPSCKSFGLFFRLDGSNRFGKQRRRRNSFAQYDVKADTMALATLMSVLGQEPVVTPCLLHMDIRTQKEFLQTLPTEQNLA